MKVNRSAVEIVHIIDEPLLDHSASDADRAHCTSGKLRPGVYLALHPMQPDANRKPGVRYVGPIVSPQAVRILTTSSMAFGGRLHATTPPPLPTGTAEPRVMQHNRGRGCIPGHGEPIACIPRPSLAPTMTAQV